MKLLSFTLFLLIAMSVSAQGIKLGIYSSVNYNYRSLGSFEETDFGEKFKLNKSMDHGKTNFGLGFQVDYTFSERWSVLWSTNYLNRGYIAPDAEFRFPNELDGNGGFVGLDNLKKEYNLRTFTIPLSIQYNFSISQKQVLGLHLGPHIAWIISQNKEIQIRQSTEERWVTSYENSSFSTIISGMTGGINYQYSVNEKFNLLLALNNHTSFDAIQNRPFKENLWSISANLGIEIPIR